jgi:hypothetical protein
MVGSLLRIVDLAQIQHVPLHHASSADRRVLDNAPLAVLLPILPANFAREGGQHQCTVVDQE